MLSRTQPPADIVLDVTAMDTGHRTRGIGRYASALWEAISRLDQDIVALRMEDSERAWRTTLPDRHLIRFMQSQRNLGAELRRAGCRVFGATEPWTLPRPTSGLRVVPTCHDVIPLEFESEYGGWDNAKWSVYFRWLRSTQVLNDCPAIIAPSHATKRALRQYLGVDADRVVVIPHGVDHSRFRPPERSEILRVRSRLNLGAEPYFVYVGGHDYRKNVPRLVEGFAASGLQDDVLLVLGGQASSAERDAVFKAARRTGVMRRLVWSGRIRDADLAGLYGGAQAFIYPSLSEGFGLQVLEAMACGCPVITSNRGALAEVAADAGVCVNPDRPDALGAACRALADDTAYNRYRARGLQHAGAFSWERTARATLDVYRTSAD